MSNIEEFIKYVNKNRLGEINTTKTFKELTTLRIGGKIRCFFAPLALDELITAYKYIIENNLKYLVIGSGSNMLVSDKDFDIIVISLKYLNKVTQLSSNVFIASAGIKTIVLSNMLADMGYTNHEFLACIPATLGGAIYMNAGCFNQNIENIVKEVIFLDEASNLITIPCNELDFNYRSSIFKKLKGIIISVVFYLDKEPSQLYSHKLIKEMMASKKEIQNIKYYTAGSTFKNKDNIKAWEVIDKLGYRGYEYKDVIISENHTNFICNKKNATFNDMIEVIEKVKQDALNKQNINLECEWEIII